MTKLPNSGEPPNVNIIARGSAFVGTLKAEDDIRISGSLEGTVRSDARVVVTAEGSIDGEVFAKSSTVAGEVIGKLVVEEQLMVQGSARIEGSIEAERLVVEDGAAFNCQCQIGAQGREVDKKLKLSNSRPLRTVSAEATKA